MRLTKDDGYWILSMEDEEAVYSLLSPNGVDFSFTYTPKDKFSDVVAYTADGGVFSSYLNSAYKGEFELLHKEWENILAFVELT